MPTPRIKLSLSDPVNSDGARTRDASQSSKTQSSSSGNASNTVAADAELPKVAQQQIVIGMLMLIRKFRELLDKGRGVAAPSAAEIDALLQTYKAILGNMRFWVELQSVLFSTPPVETTPVEPKAYHQVVETYRELVQAKKNTLERFRKDSMPGQVASAPSQGSSSDQGEVPTSESESTYTKLEKKQAGILAEITNLKVNFAAMRYDVNATHHQNLAVRSHLHMKLIEAEEHRVDWEVDVIDWVDKVPPDSEEDLAEKRMTRQVEKAWKSLGEVVSRADKTFNEHARLHGPQSSTHLSPPPMGRFGPANLLKRGR
jgi:hypothetical protein